MTNKVHRVSLVLKTHKLSIEKQMLVNLNNATYYILYKIYLVLNKVASLVLFKRRLMREHVSLYRFKVKQHLLRTDLERKQYLDYIGILR